MITCPAPNLRASAWMKLVKARNIRKTAGKKQVAVRMMMPTDLCCYSIGKVHIAIVLPNLVECFVQKKERVLAYQCFLS